MEITEGAEEVLEMLWIATQEMKENGIPVDELSMVDVDTLLVLGLASLPNDIVTLTDKGFPEARSVVRRHRLAERLLTDVLGTRENSMHDTACRFEHILDRGLDDSICTLLGHPKVCPHGKPIPPGKCCEEEQVETGQVVAPLSHLLPGSQGKVAYVHATEASNLQKLMAMGILPGAPIKLLQKFPSFIFEAGYTQFAVDEQIADAIFVRQTGEESIVPVGELIPGKNRRRRRGRRRWFSGRI